MNVSMKNKMASVCREKIAKKGSGVNVSFYAFFANKNDQPELLMDVATWWIQTHQLDHFEKATHILTILEEPTP